MRNGRNSKLNKRIESEWANERKSYWNYWSTRQCLQWRAGEHRSEPGSEEFVNKRNESEMKAKVERLTHHHRRTRNRMQ